jgi:hypothetical protein
MPGAVGLAILDSFAMQIPIITTDMPFHGPEIEYLKNEYNGVMVAPADDVDRYVYIVVGLLRDQVRLKKLMEQCAHSAAVLTIENMANCFFDGIVRALASDKNILS